MGHIVVEEVETDEEERPIHQFNKLLLAVGVGYIVGELTKKAYDHFVINRNKNKTTYN